MTSFCGKYLFVLPGPDFVYQSLVRMAKPVAWHVYVVLPSGFSNGLAMIYLVVVVPILLFRWQKNQHLVQSVYVI